ncbi:Monoacylglycerol lipase ABHD12 [Cytospora mali]|uniref:Monoacylglycerol lipase ABHD12 n=1 Tax=Cytospora mali TaxID=578113 RepID=A0A194URF2_CYTMA|nr:Monoacylglycerol lipase ABHD12 [Valsa mali var. pyri (nom. inval.)]
MKSDTQPFLSKEGVCSGCGDGDDGISEVSIIQPKKPLRLAVAIHAIILTIYTIIFFFTAINNSLKPLSIPQGMDSFEDTTYSGPPSSELDRNWGNLMSTMRIRVSDQELAELDQTWEPGKRHPGVDLNGRPKQFCANWDLLLYSIKDRVVGEEEVTLTWFKDLNVPEQFGFQHNEVFPFRIPTEDNVSLHARHILPLGVYRRNYQELLDQKILGAMGDDTEFTKTLNFRLLLDDPEVRLIIYMHGTSGTMASGYRPDSYRALYSGAPDKIHILTFDYRGFGLSIGVPSEPGLLVDAVSVFDWATKVAGIPPERIVIFGRSLGSAVSIALANYLAAQVPSVSCAGLVITSSFSDLASLTATYLIGGLISVLSPVAKFPRIFHYFCQHLTSTWLNKDRIAELVRTSDRYHITLLHSEDDSDIPAEHTEVLYWNAVNATSESNLSFGAFEEEKERKKIRLEEGGWSVEWHTEKGLIRQDMPKYGVHDKIMSYPIVGMAVLRAFQSVDPQFEV